MAIACTCFAGSLLFRSASESELAEKPQGRKAMLAAEQKQASLAEKLISKEGPIVDQTEASTPVLFVLLSEART